MAKGIRKWWYILGLLAFIIYIFISARPIPEETIFKPRWIISLESNVQEGNPNPGGSNPDGSNPDGSSAPRWGFPVSLGDISVTEGGKPLPFRLGDRFGYIWDDGKFAINQIVKGYVSISENTWAEYEALPSSIQVMNSLNEPVLTIENPKGYPLFLDDRIFMVGGGQDSLTALGPDGEELWIHDFPAPITCIDAAGGYVLSGTLDGAVELINSSGIPVFTPFEPGGSRLSVILGCAISRDASHLAVISGIDDQRFLLLERAGGDGRLGARDWTGLAGNPGETYKVVYHEFLPNGFRRPVHISFVDNDTKVAFERDGGLGIYDINSHTSANLKLEGEIVALDNSGGSDFLFVITSRQPKQMSLIVIRYPASIVNKVPFTSDNAYFARRNNTVYIGGDVTMISLELEKK